MADSTHQALAAALWNARQAGTVVTTEQHPTDVASAYALLAAVTDASGREIVGYKLGATAEATLNLLQLTAPFGGPLLKDCCHSSGAAIAVHSTQNPAIETEFVLGLSHNLPTTDTLTESEVAAAVGWIAGGFEIISARFATMPTGRGLCTIADGAGNFQVITGKKYADWKALELAALPATLSINGEAVASGASNDSLHGSPLAMLTWFANSNLVPERGLRAGDMIYCGTCTGAIPIKPGDKISADFGVLGLVETSVIAS